MAKTHGFGRTKLYWVWKNMNRKCTSPKHPKYKHYGGRNISVCKEWADDFMVFREWALTHGYEEGLELERNDNDGNYTLENCMWETRSRNKQNRRLHFINNTSGYRCVFFMPQQRTNSWMAKITHEKVVYFLGLYHTPELAAQVVNDFIIEHKTKHPLNIIPDNPAIPYPKNT